MASVQAVYNSLKDLTNKEQKGFITPQIFNSLASLAQMNIYNEFFTELIDVKKLSRQGFELGRDKSIRKFKLEDLSFMVRSATVDSSNNVFDRPDDLSRIISIRINNTFDFTSVDSRTLCETLYDVGKMDAILGSNLSTPTESFPVALIGREIEVFPSTINSIIITYYKKPTSFEVGTRNESPLQPAYNAFEQWDGSLQFNPVGSLDFMLPDHCIPEIVNEMAKLLGVRLRDQNVQVTATREEASE
jgi:hypothetical protein